MATTIEENLGQKSATALSQEQERGPLSRAGEGLGERFFQDD
jgi:hypothetical protein